MMKKAFVITILIYSLMITSCANKETGDISERSVVDFSDTSSYELSHSDVFESGKNDGSFDSIESTSSEIVNASKQSSNIVSSSGSSAATTSTDPTGTASETDPDKYSWEKEIETMANKNPASKITIDLNAKGVKVSQGIYAAGYDGWGDITNEKSLTALKEVRLKYLRIVVDLSLAAGNTAGGPVDITCKAQKDGDLNLVQRIKHAQNNGFTPIIVFSTNHALPSYFHPSQDKISNWFQYDTDGTKATNHIGNQIDEYARIAGEVARQLMNEGLSGLIWESIYEIGYGYAPFGMTPVAIHYETAKAIKGIDPASKHIGPATWTGWAVEKFVDDYFRVYGKDGAEYLDYVSFHQYGGNYVIKNTDLWDGNKQVISMVLSDDHTQNGLPIKNLTILRILSSVPKAAADSTKALHEKLKAMSSQYGFTKKIGVAVTEYDVNNYSNYMKNPSNPNYPAYDPASDTNINTNFFGGVNTAYMIAACALSEADMLIKFNTRQYYGIVDHDYDNGSQYYRTPLWHSLKLLQEKLGLTGDAEIMDVSVEGPIDTVSGYEQPWIFSCAVRKDGKTSILVINRSDIPLNTKLNLKNIKTGTTFNRYIYSDKTTAAFIGNRRPNGNEYDGIFEGGINDGWEDFKKGVPGSSKNICLFPKGVITPVEGTVELTLDKFSYVILEMNGG